MTEIIETLDAIIDERSLLKHPFYQAWTAGTLPVESLREYAKQYFHFEAAFPTFLSAVHAHCEPGETRQAILENLWDEEHGTENHLALWMRFCDALGLDAREVRASEPNAETRDLIDGFRAACANGSVAEGLATIYAYESQAPEVARQKIAGLQRFYNMDEKGYSFFSVHQELDVAHSQAERSAVAAAVRAGVSRASLEDATRSAADRLWRFLGGAYAGACAS
jgi:pyrroloquinoline-quinone synthase